MFFHRIEQLGDAGPLVGRILHGLESRALDDWRVVVSLRLQAVSRLLDDKLQKVGVGDVHLVDEHDDLLHTHLASKQDVLLRLMLDALAAVDQEDSPIHLGRPRDHVLDVVGVPRAVDVRVVARVRFVLDVSDGDRDRLGRVPNDATLGDVGVLFDFGELLIRLDGQDGGR